MHITRQAQKHYLLTINITFVQTLTNINNRTDSNTNLSMPGIVQNNGRVRVVAQKDGHQGRDELMTQCVPGGGDLQQCQHQHVWAVLDWEAEQLLHLLILAHLRQPKQALHQVETFPVKSSRQTYSIREC